MLSNLFPQQKLLLASNNQGKLNELQQMFAGLDWPVQVLPQRNFQIEDAIEDGLSFVENALIKARHAARLSGLPALADDSGLCIPVLNGAPGIYSARFGGEHGNDARNNQAVLDALKPHRQPDRSEQPIAGMFVCVLALVRHADDPLPIICQGIWHGEILDAPRGSAGFGYDPLFWLPTLGKSSAELDKTEKNQISHRGLAMRALLRELRDLSQT